MSAIVAGAVVEVEGKKKPGGIFFINTKWGFVRGHRVLNGRTILDTCADVRLAKTFDTHSECTSLMAKVPSCSHFAILKNCYE